MLLRNPAIQIIGNRNERERVTSSTVASSAVLSPAKVPPSGNEKPEPHQNTQDPKEDEASSRLEALLRCTSQLSVSSHDLNRPQFEVARLDLTTSSLKSTQKATSSQHKKPFHTAAGEDSSGGTSCTGTGKRYRSSIRIMVRPEAVTNLQKPIRANSSDGLSRSSSSSSGTNHAAAKKMSAAGVRISASRTSEVGQPHTARSIVKEQFRYESLSEKNNVFDVTTHNVGRDKHKNIENVPFLEKVLTSRSSMGVKRVVGRKESAPPPLNISDFLETFK